VRTCIGCRERVVKSALLRVTARSDETGQLAVTADPTGTAPGRGAHLHPTRECFELATRRRAFGRALRLDGSFSTAPVGEFVAAHQPDQLT
jgi:predicted RNA-binding protein YlxR (DUF448 family)